MTDGIGWISQIGRTRWIDWTTGRIVLGKEPLHMQEYKHQPDFPSPEERAKHLVSKMTLKEMFSQLLYDSPAIPRLSIPAYNWWNEGLHGAARSGTATVFPQAIGLAAMFDVQATKEIAGIVATEQRAKYNAFSQKGDRGIYKGLTVWAPNINIFRDPRWGRGQETYGEDPFLASRLGVAFIEGLQGENADVLKTASCVKHFVAHSGPEPERHHFNAMVSAKDLTETYLPAFKACVKEAGVDGVMGAYSLINGEPCCGTHLIQSLLRNGWGFKGMFVSDCWAIRDFHEQHKITRTAEESAALALNSGCDLNCGCTYLALEKAYQKGLVTREAVTQACVRVMTTRFRLGLFDKEGPYSDIPFSVVASEPHASAALDAARKSLVLLKNDDTFLPLDTGKIASIAVIGPNADSRQALWGNYHGTSQRYTTVLEGIRRLAPDTVRVYYSEGCSVMKDRVERLGEPNDRLSEAATAAGFSDVVVLCLGLNEIVEGEMHDDGNGGIAGDKKDLRLPACQRELLAAVAGTGKPIVLLLLSGGAMDPEIETYPNVRAFIQCWYPGESGGQAIAETLFGMNNPSGKLPVTFYRADTVLPDFSDYSMRGRTYRYFEGTPLYPFGFGLSYSRFQYSSLTIEYESECVRAVCRLKNTSDRDGDEVTFVWGRTEHPDAPANPALFGFTRTFLRAGEERTVDIPIPWESFTIVDTSGTRRPVPGIWNIRLGGHQGDPRSESLAGTGVLALDIDTSRRTIYDETNEKR